MSGRAPETLDVMLAEGETKHVVLGAGRAAAAGPRMGNGPAGSPGGPQSGPSAGPWVVGGVGLASLVVAGVTGGLALHDKSVNDAGCSVATQTCTLAGLQAGEQGRILGPVTTAALAVGVVGVAASALWLGVRRSTTEIAVEPEVGGVSVRLKASWQ